MPSVTSRGACLEPRCPNRRPCPLHPELTAKERGYDSSWRAARLAYLQAHPSCVTCGQPATVVDHRVPHRGDKRLFWDKTNWQSMCESCHNAKAAQEKAGGAWRVGRQRERHHFGIG